MPANAAAVSFDWIMFVAMGAVAFLLLAGCAAKGTTGATTAVIAAKAYRPASTYSQHQHGSNRGFQSPVSVPIAAGYMLALDADGLGRVEALVDEHTGATLAVGDRVNITYLVRRSLGLFKRTFVTEVTRPVN